MAYVSMGAVGALTPMHFESVGAGTHGFWQILRHSCILVMEKLQN